MNNETTPKQRRAKAARLAVMLKDREELIGALNAAASLRNTLNSLTADLNAEVLALKGRFAERIEKVKAEFAEREQSATTYIEMHRHELFKKDEKTAVISGHTIKFRNNGGAVAAIKGCTQAGALDRLLMVTGKEEDIADKFLSCDWSLNKQGIKDLFEEHKDFLTRMGLTVEDTESLSIEYALEDGAESKVSKPVEAVA